MGGRWRPGQHTQEQVMREVTGRLCRRPEAGEDYWDQVSRKLCSWRRQLGHLLTLRWVSDVYLHEKATVSGSLKAGEWSPWSENRATSGFSPFHR